MQRRPLNIQTESSIDAREHNKQVAIRKLLLSDLVGLSNSSNIICKDLENIEGIADKIHNEITKDTEGFHKNKVAKEVMKLKLLMKEVDLRITYLENFGEGVLDALGS